MFEIAGGILLATFVLLVLAVCFANAIDAANRIGADRVRDARDAGEQ